MNGDFQRQEKEISGGRERYALRELWEACDRLKPVRGWERGRYQLVQALRGIQMSPVAATVTTLTISVTLFLLSALLVVYQNVSQALTGVEQSRQISVFFKDTTSPELVEQMRITLSSEPSVEDVQYVSKEEALESFRTSLGSNASLLTGLADENPLPESLEIVLGSSPLAREEKNRLLLALKKNAEVEHVQDNHGLVREIGQMVQKLHVGGAVAICITLIMTGFIISNTVQLALFSRRAEVEIMRLVGATDRFIRTPFLIEGALQGVVGAVMGMLILSIVQNSLWGLMSELELVQLTTFEISFLTPLAIIGVVIMGCAVGVGGSYLAVRRFSVEQS
jgi:cell division transport system permease protein